jgi:hypothetical protein
MTIVYIDERQYEIQEQNEVPIRYSDIHRPISSSLLSRRVAPKKWK